MQWGLLKATNLYSEKTTHDLTINFIFLASSGDTVSHTISIIFPVVPELTK